MAQQTPEQIRKRPEYLENVARRVSILGWGGPFIIMTDRVDNDILLGREQCYLNDDPFVGKAPLALVTIYPSYEAAIQAVNKTIRDIDSAGSKTKSSEFVVYTFYYGPSNLIFPTIVSATTAPNVTTALRLMREQEAKNAEAASKTLLEAFITLSGVRMMPAAVLEEAGASEGLAGSRLRSAAAAAPSNIVDRAKMLKFLLQIWRRTPLLKRLQAAQRLAGPAQQRELINILTEFENTTGVAVQRVKEGVVQGQRGAGNLASLRSRPGFLQIEEQVFKNTQTLLKEIRHELPYYYTGVEKQLMLSNGIKAHELLEWIIENGEEAVTNFLRD